AHTVGTQLHLQLFEPQGAGAASRRTKSKTIAKLNTWLKNNQTPELEHITSVQISVHRTSPRPIWSQTIPMPGAKATFADHDVTSFQSRLVQMFGFPGLLAIAILMNGMPPIKFLLRGVTIWFHEFGHATVAWLAGRKAIPLPFGWTNVDPARSLFVYVGILILFGLLGWAGYRERRWWPVVLAITLAIVQFVMTWIMPTQTFEMLLSFGGIGGEFYLCTLLIVSFFFPLPDYFRWELYRYPVVIGAAFTFWGNFSLWHQIERGRQAIPWGSLWGGPSHEGGDMNQLSLVYNWSDRQIIDTYNALGAICLSLIVGVYLYFMWKNQRSHLMLFWHQCLASYWK
ncbi:MAG: M50 family metallopeptidase, partial [Cyanobacteria bacterium P01_F01_bin.42]